MSTNQQLFVSNGLLIDPSERPKATEVDRVIYHAKCPDGTAGAWIFWRENLDRFNSGTFPIDGFTHGQPPPDVTNETVIIVDFCFSREVLISMASKAKKIIVLDHHVSAQRSVERDGADTLPSNLELHFDLTKSGSQIAWDYVYGDIHRPFFIDVIADRDLWKWQIPGSKEIGKALSVRGYYTWERMEDMYTLWAKGDDNFFKEMINVGRLIGEQEEKEISILCSKAILSEMTVGGQKYRVKLVSCPSNYRSEVGHRLCNDDSSLDFAVLWQYDFLLDEWWLSCRSSESSDVDLSKICSLFERGGGHKNASGFTIFGSQKQNLHTYFKPLEVPKNRPRDWI